MKKRIVLALSLLSAAPLAADCGLGDYTAQNYFSDIPLFMSASPERISLVRIDRMSLRDGGRGGFFEAVVLGGASTNNDKLGRWFFPYHKTKLIVAEGEDFINNDPADPNIRDVDAQHFNINTVDGDFRSTISICPKQTFAGIGFLGQKGFCFNECGDPRWYGEISIPVIRREQTLNFKEVIQDDGGGLLEGIGLDDAPFVANMTEAMNQSAMRYQKIRGNCCKMHKTGVEDIELKLGYNQFNCEVASISAYVGAIVPTGNKVNDGGDWCGYLWQPIVGNGKHFGLMWGTDLRFALCEWECSSLTFYTNSNSRFLFSNDQIRSFDVYDKSWSHYMMMYASQDAANAAGLTSGSFGTNVMTLCVNVNPRFSFATNAAFLYERQHFLAEAGYHFFARQAEEIELNSFNKAPAFRSATGNGFTNTARTIGKRYTPVEIAPANYNTAVIKSGDINLNSGGHPGLIAHTVYATLGYQWGELCYPTVLGLGGSYQFSSTNAAIDRWMLWAKVGVSF